jgi:hypothetical protein
LDLSGGEKGRTAWLIDFAWGYGSDGGVNRMARWAVNWDDTWTTDGQTETASEHSHPETRKNTNPQSCIWLSKFHRTIGSINRSC